MQLSVGKRQADPCARPAAPGREVKAERGQHPQADSTGTGLPNLGPSYQLQLLRVVPSHLVHVDPRILGRVVGGHTYIARALLGYET